MSQSESKKEAKELHKRLKQLASLYDSSSAFARETGLTRQMAGYLLSGDFKSVTSSTLASIARGTGCSADWLLLGRGTPFSKTDRDETGRLRATMDFNDLKNEIGKNLDAGSNGSSVEFIRQLRDLCNIYLKVAKTTETEEIS